MDAPDRALGAARGGQAAGGTAPTTGTPPSTGSVGRDTPVGHAPGRPTPVPPLTAQVEICATTLEEAVAAEIGGAHRVELCTSLEVDGLTPDSEVIAAVRQRLTIPVFVLVRPWGGEYTYDADEIAAMKRIIVRCRALEADGIVTGALLPDGRVDEEAMQQLMEAARPLPVTFHRAVDRAPDHVEAVETLLALGVDRVLTSGGAPTAREGAATIAAMARRAGEALTVVAGGRVRAEHAGALVRTTGVREVHAHLGADRTAVARLVASVGSVPR